MRCAPALLVHKLRLLTYPLYVEMSSQRSIGIAVHYLEFHT